MTNNTLPRRVINAVRELEAAGMTVTKAAPDAIHYRGDWTGGALLETSLGWISAWLQKDGITWEAAVTRAHHKAFGHSAAQARKVETLARMGVDIFASPLKAARCVIDAVNG